MALEASVFAGGILASEARINQTPSVFGSSICAASRL